MHRPPCRPLNLYSHLALAYELATTRVAAPSLSCRRLTHQGAGHRSLWPQPERQQLRASAWGAPAGESCERRGSLRAGACKQASGAWAAGCAAQADDARAAAATVCATARDRAVAAFERWDGYRDHAAAHTDD